MPHPNEQILRDAYRAFAVGDMPGFLALCAPDIRFKVPGKGTLSGDHARDDFFKLLGPAMERTGNTFREEIVHLAAGDRDGFVLVAQQLTRDGETLRWHACHHWSIAIGKLAKFWELTDDERTFERAWR